MNLSVQTVFYLMNQFSQNNVGETAIVNENQVINKSSFTPDLIKSIQYMNKNDINEMTVAIAAP